MVPHSWISGGAVGIRGDLNIQWEIQTVPGCCRLGISDGGTEGLLNLNDQTMCPKYRSNQCIPIERIWMDIFSMTFY